MASSRPETFAMSASAKEVAALALQRFGMGPRLGSISAIASDPRGALIAEIERPDAVTITAQSLRTSAEAFRAVAEANAERQARRVVAARDRKSDAPPMPALEVPDPMRPIFQAEARARIEAGLKAQIGFAERLVWFWSNHLCVSASKILSMTPAYEREAIRPHVLGRFEALLQAVESHPAMLFYLDNAASMGANSIAGINRRRGLNENLAREILELHTLGVRAGYSQTDVTALANVLTGWTVIPAGDNPEHAGQFVFNRQRHEPGPKTVLGKVYEQVGIVQGRAVLRDLARHSSTAKHIAGRLVSHFIADEPPPDLVDRIAAKFRDTDGDLKEVAKALAMAPESWSLPLSKLRRPSEWAMAVTRAAGLEADPRRFLGAQATLGEPLWRPPSPKGYADDQATWIDGLGQRLDLTNSFAERIAGRIDPRFVMETVFEGTMSRDTTQAVGRAESRQQALVLLFMAPEFQRR
jgi:uncharacterized protein (DUF1800 family)